MSNGTTLATQDRRDCQPRRGDPRSVKARQGRTLNPPPVRWAKDVTGRTYTDSRGAEPRVDRVLPMLKMLRSCATAEEGASVTVAAPPPMDASTGLEFLMTAVHGHASGKTADLVERHLRPFVVNAVETLKTVPESERPGQWAQGLLDLRSRVQEMLPEIETRHEEQLATNYVEAPDPAEVTAAWTKFFELRFCPRYPFC